MDKKKALKLAAQIVFFGGIWGITEATLGFLLHFLPVYVAGLVMFPIAVFILAKAYKATTSRWALVYIGFIAAGIKAVDLLVPGIMTVKVVNPMISIIMEASIVAVVYPMLKSTDWKTRVSGAAVASVAWRMGFVVVLTIQYLINGFVAKHIASAWSFVDFVLINGIISGLLAYAAVEIEPKLALRKLRFRPVYALAALAVAVGLQLLI